MKLYVLLLDFFLKRLRLKYCSNKYIIKCDNFRIILHFFRLLIKIIKINF